MYFFRLCACWASKIKSTANKIPCFISTHSFVQFTIFQSLVFVFASCAFLNRSLIILLITQLTSTAHAITIFLSVCRLAVKKKVFSKQFSLQFYCRVFWTFFGCYSDKLAPYNYTLARAAPCVNIKKIKRLSGTSVYVVSSLRVHMWKGTSIISYP